MGKSSRPTPARATEPRGTRNRTKGAGNSRPFCLAERYVRLHTVNCGLSLTVILDLIGDSPLRIRTASLRAERSNLLLSSCIVDGWRLLRRTAPRNDERSEEHTSELQSLMRISFADFCW